MFGISLRGIYSVQVASYIEHKKVYTPILNKQPEKAAKAAEKLVLGTSKLISQAAEIYESKCKEQQTS